MMYSSIIKSGESEIIESNTVISFNPAPYGKNPLKNNSNIPRPIEIDCYYGKEFLFKLHFEFFNSVKDKKPSWKSHPEGNQTQKFIITNLDLSNGPISSSLAFDVASGNDGSVFYVAFSASKLDLNIKLEYTIYRVKGVLPNENKHE